MRHRAAFDRVDVTTSFVLRSGPRPITLREGQDGHVGCACKALDVEDRPTRLAAQASWSASNRILEADLRSDLAAILVPSATNDAGVPQAGIRQEGTGSAGRFDSLIGDVLIEYKRPRLLRAPGERAHAARQALEYLEDPSFGARAVVITDGEVSGFLRAVAGDVEVGEQAVLSFDEPHHIPAEARFTWRAFDERTARALLELIAAQRAAAVTSRSVIGFLGTGRAEIVELLRTLVRALHTRAESGRTDTLLGQWVRSAGIPYGIDRPDAPWPREGARSLLGGNCSRWSAKPVTPEAIYVLHTYVALAAKVIAAEVLAVQRGRNDLRPSEWSDLGDAKLVERLVDLERGDVAEQLAAPGPVALSSASLTNRLLERLRADRHKKIAARLQPVHRYPACRPENLRTPADPAHRAKSRRRSGPRLADCDSAS